MLLKNIVNTLALIASQLLTYFICLQNTNLRVEFIQANETIKSQDLIEYINEGKLKIMTSFSIEKSAIMVLGLTGVGKTTLINYLNGIPLKCTRINGVWRLDLANRTNSSASKCDFLKIGHANSETLYPTACSPNNGQGQTVTYIDTPGFQDNRGFEIEIGNSFFRAEILRHVEELKFLLIINYADVIDRRVQFYDTVKRLSDFLGEMIYLGIHLKTLPKKTFYQKTVSKKR
jgi:energy-coupling factor transporter ATP-binding protein EcfA2